MPLNDKGGQPRVPEQVVVGYVKMFLWLSKLKELSIFDSNPTEIRTEFYSDIRMKLYRYINLVSGVF